MKYYIDVLVVCRSSCTEIERTYRYNTRGEMRGKLHDLMKQKEYRSVVLKDVFEELMDYGHEKYVFGKLKRGSEL